MKRRRWIATLGIGLLGNWAITWAFDFLLYPFVISTYGLLIGAPVMTFLSFLICYASILFYDGTKRDWLGIETIKGLEEFNSLPIPNYVIGKIFVSIINAVGNATAWVMKKSDALAMVILSIKFDPFITVIHIRHGAHQYNGLSKRDWKVFLVSLLIGNAYWTLAVYMGITLFEVLWRFGAGLFIY